MQGLMWAYLIVHCLGASATHLSPVACNDKSVEKLARLAITYINEDRQSGYKFALNRIFNVHVHPQGPAGKVYYLDLDVLETKCHILSPKSWKHCEIRPFMETQISGNCNTTVLHTHEGFSYLYSYDCTLVPDTPEKLQRKCPDCPLLLAVDSEKAVSTAKSTLQRYNHQSTLPIKLSLGAIIRASHQISPVIASFVEYTVKECSVAPLEEVFCMPADAGKGAVGFCTGAVFGAVQAGVKVSCEIFYPQRIGVSVADGIPQQEEKSITQQEAPAPPLYVPDAHVPPTFQDASPGLPRLVDPVQQLIPHRVMPHPSHSPASSESSESMSDSSEELLGSVQIIRPPQDFHYAALWQKRQAPALIKPPQSHIFLAVFPSTPSPFRSCPGVSRYTTV